MRSRRILDREKTHELKYLRAHFVCQKLHFWDYKHNVTRVSDWENVSLASWRTVTNTRVMRNVHSAAVELGKSSHELKKTSNSVAQSSFWKNNALLNILIYVFSPDREFFLIYIVPPASFALGFTYSVLNYNTHVFSIF